MQGTTAILRVGARALVLALASLMLVVLGCTGAQASPASLPVAAAGTVAPAGQLHQDALQSAGPRPGTALVATAGHIQTTCIPGRGKARAESDAVAPSHGQAQPSPGGIVAALPHGAGGGTAPATLQGRIPASPTHLDLGIVRT